MQATMDDKRVDDIDRHVKPFLTILCRLQIASNSKSGESTKLKIKTTSNLSGLLNITTYMRDYGPLRNYWEGGYKGEGLLRYIKPLANQGTHKPYYAKQLIHKYYKDRFLQYILNLDLAEEEETEDDIPERYTEFRTYNNNDLIQTSISKGDAVSVIIRKDKSMCASFTSNKQHSVCDIVPDDSTGEIIDVTYVTTLTLGGNAAIDKTKITTVSYVLMWGLAVPLKANSEGVHLYYIITSEWMERFFDKATHTASYILSGVDGCSNEQYINSLLVLMFYYLF
jgi:hypothetical protein